MEKNCKIFNHKGAHFPQLSQAKSNNSKLLLHKLNLKLVMLDFRLQQGLNLLLYQLYRRKVPLKIDTVLKHVANKEDQKSRPQHVSEESHNVTDYISIFWIEVSLCANTFIQYGEVKNMYPCLNVQEKVTGFSLYQAELQWRPEPFKGRISCRGQRGERKVEEGSGGQRRKRFCYY